MKIRTLSILALAALAGTAACKKGDTANGGDSTATTQDTSVVTSTTQDTVVKTTETETSVDTMKGNVTTPTDSTAVTDTTKTDTTKKM